MKTKLYVPAELYHRTDMPALPDLTEKDVLVVPDGIISLDHHLEYTGVYHPNGELVVESVPDRGVLGGNREPHSKKIKPNKVVNDSILYIGTDFVFRHFGHFWIEGIARLWPLLYKKYRGVKVAIAVQGKRTIPSFVRQTLNALGVADKDIVIVNKDTKFSRVFVPKQSEIIGVCILPITKRLADAIADALEIPDVETYDKIYFSRGAMNDGRTFGEPQIEKVFAKNGYKVIYPEKLPLAHQITLVRHCKTMAGTAGSALHLALFMRPGGRVIQIKRNTTTSDNIHVQEMLNNLCGLETVFVAGSIETVPTEHFSIVPQIVGITPQMLQFFDDNGFKYDETDLQPDTVEFARYLRQIKRHKMRVLYSHIVGVPIRMIAFFGITKMGQRHIRQYLKRLVRAF